MHRFRLSELRSQWEGDNRQRLSQKKIAEETGISMSVLSRMADPKGYVTTTRNVELLCRFFGVGPGDLMEILPESEG